MSRIKYICDKCGHSKETSMEFCPKCGGGGCIVTVNHAPIYYAEVVYWMTIAPKPWPLSIKFFPED